MKKLLFLAIAVVAAYLAWTRFGPSKERRGDLPADVRPATNAQQRIDTLSGTAPE